MERARDPLRAKPFSRCYTVPGPHALLPQLSHSAALDRKTGRYQCEKRGGSSKATNDQQTDFRTLSTKNRKEAPPHHTKMAERPHASFFSQKENPFFCQKPAYGQKSFLLVQRDSLRGRRAPSCTTDSLVIFDCLSGFHHLFFGILLNEFWSPIFLRNSSRTDFLRDF